jgi:ATP-binding cassette, subfamily C, bacterial
MKQVFRIFFTAEDTKPWMVVFCLILAGFAEAIGVTALLPAVQAITNSSGQSGSTSPVIAFAHDMMARFGIPPTFASFIVIVVVFYSLKALLSFVALSYAGMAIARVSTALRRKLITALFDARWSFYLQLHSGRIAHSISTDTAAAGSAYFIAAQIVAFSVQGLVYCLVAF